MPTQPTVKEKAIELFYQGFEVNGIVEMLNSLEYIDRFGSEITQRHVKYYIKGLKRPRKSKSEKKREAAMLNEFENAGAAQPYTIAAIRGDIKDLKIHPVSMSDDQIREIWKKEVEAAENNRKQPGGLNIPQLSAIRTGWICPQCNAGVDRKSVV